VFLEKRARDVVCRVYVYKWMYSIHICVRYILYIYILYIYIQAASVTNALERQEGDLEERARDVVCRVYIYT